MPPKSLLAMMLLAASLAGAAGAQPVLDVVQDLDFDRPESWAMKYFASASLPTGMGPPRALEPGSVRIGLEAGWLPSLSAAERTVGFGGTKEEDLNRSSVLPRPRLLIGLPAKLSLDLGLVPPVDIDGVEPRLLSIALGRPLWETPAWRVGLRLTALDGTLEGDITCSAGEAAAGPDPARNPFFCEAPSNDELSASSVGLELSASRRLGSSGFEPYAALAIHEMDLEFQIDARWSGLVDRTLQRTDGTTWYATAGFRYANWRRAELGVELFYSPLDVVRPPATATRTDELFNVRTVFRYKIR